MSISTSAPSTSMSAACARRSTAAILRTRSAPCAAPAIRWTIVSARRAEQLSASRHPSRLAPLAPQDDGSGSARRALIATPVARRLIGHARVIGAVGQSAERIAAAEEKVAAAGIADRPAAGLLVQFKNGTALADRNDVVDQFRLGFAFDVISMRERGIAADRGPPDAQHVRGGARFALPRRRARRALGAAGESQSMHLADHRVAGDAAKLGRDLTGRQAVRPQFLQKLDPLVCPRHEQILLTDTRRVFIQFLSVQRLPNPWRTNSWSTLGRIHRHARRRNGRPTRTQPMTL